MELDAVPDIKKNFLNIFYEAGSQQYHLNYSVELTK